MNSLLKSVQTRLSAPGGRSAPGSPLARAHEAISRLSSLSGFSSRLPIAFPPLDPSTLLESTCLRARFRVTASTASIQAQDEASCTRTVAYKRQFVGDVSEKKGDTWKMIRGDIMLCKWSEKLFCCSVRDTYPISGALPVRRFGLERSESSCKRRLLLSLSLLLLYLLPCPNKLSRSPSLPLGFKAPSALLSSPRPGPLRIHEQRSSSSMGAPPLHLLHSTSLTNPFKNRYNNHASGSGTIPAQLAAATLSRVFPYDGRGFGHTAVSLPPEEFKGARSKQGVTGGWKRQMEDLEFWVRRESLGSKSGQGVGVWPFNGEFSPLSRSHCSDKITASCISEQGGLMSLSLPTFSPTSANQSPPLVSLLEGIMVAAPVVEPKSHLSPITVQNL